MTDWKFLEEEILELLDHNGFNDSNVEDLEDLVNKFLRRLERRYIDESSELIDEVEG